MRRTPSGQGPARGGPRARVAPGASAFRTGAGPALRRWARGRPRRLSVHTAALALVLLAFVLAYVYPVQVYLAQQARIDQLRTEQQAQRDRIAALTEQLARWDDDEYVIGQARSRLQLVREGELLYVVGAPPAQDGGAPPDQQDEWFRQLWDNLQVADDPAGR